MARRARGSPGERIPALWALGVVVAVLIATLVVAILGQTGGGGHSAAGSVGPVATHSPAGQPSRPPATAGTSPSPGASPSPSLPPANGSVTIAAVGDTMLGNTPDLPPSPSTYLSHVAPALKGDIVFGNLEGTLTNGGYSKCGAGSTDCFAFRAPPSYAKYLRAAGFTIMNSANNHSSDFGPVGVHETTRALHRAGIAQTGLPGDITVVQGGGLKVAFLGFAPYDTTSSLLNFPVARQMIEKAKTMANLVVVYMHAGAEGADATHVTGHEEYYAGEDRGNPEAFAHMAIDTGADLVLASGPHVLRGMQFYHRHLIVYSLGNFASYNNFGTSGILGVSCVLQLRLAANGALESARIVPTELVGPGQPILDPGGQATGLIATLSKEDFGKSAARIASDGTISPP